jgi:small subunit ribosomal protein S5
MDLEKLTKLQQQLLKQLKMQRKFGGACVFLKPASSGTGVKAGGAMRAVLESVGVKDVLAKSKGSSNPHNLVKATIKALSMMRDAYTVAQHRNVSLDKVFNG